MLPRFCPACNKKLSADENTVCSICLSKIRLADDNRIKHEFERKFAGKNNISGFNSLYVFEKDKELQKIIHSLKYKQKFLTGKFLGELLGQAKKNDILTWQIDFIIPVPLHIVKKLERSYNQSFYIAKGVGKITGKRIKDSFIKRKRYTQSQTTMNIKEREENIKDAFTVKHKKKLNGKNILLIDDVITTGATTNECGKILLQGGANKVYAASIAIAD